MKMSLAACLTIAALSTACGGNKAVQINPDAQPAGARWNAIVATPATMAGATQIRGTAWMGRDGDNAQQTRAHVSISNAAPGGEHPWHVHVGQCGADKGILGPADSYGILNVGGDGKAEGDATVPVATPASGQYFVNVHASKANMGTIVACGNLAPPSR